MSAIEPPEQVVIGCYHCPDEHEGNYSHDGRFGEGPIYAVVCTVDHLTAYYTLEAAVTPVKEHTMNITPEQPIATYDMNAVDHDNALDGIDPADWHDIRSAAATARCLGSVGAKTTGRSGVDYSIVFGSEVDDHGVRRSTGEAKVYIVPEPSEYAVQVQAHRSVLNQHLRKIGAELAEIAHHIERYDLGGILDDAAPFVESVEDVLARVRSASNQISASYDHTIGDPMALRPLSEVQS